MSVAENYIKPFQPLGHYDWPSTPVDHNLDKLKEILKKRVFRRNDKDGIDLDRLDPAETRLLDEIAAPPANHPLMKDLDITLSEWIESDPPLETIKTIIFPPCDRESFLKAWAEKNSYAVLEVAEFDRKMSKSPSRIGDLFETELLVIPRLEDWFRRSETHLSSLRLLLSALETYPQKVVVGCNSWAWQFLRKSCEIDSICVNPMTFQAFDAERLSHWLEDLSGGMKGRVLKFKSAKSGDDAFDLKSGAESKTEFMSDLASQSLGIPWVAWNMWRASLRVSSEKEQSISKSQRDESQLQTLWISELKSFSLPKHQDQRALLVLQTLLIHNGLSREDIDLTVPNSHYSNVLPALMNAGLVEKVDSIYHCVPAAYPSIRDGLRSAGYPMDVL